MLRCLGYVVEIHEVVVVVHAPSRVVLARGCDGFVGAGGKIV